MTNGNAKTISGCLIGAFTIVFTVVFTIASLAPAAGADTELPRIVDVPLNELCSQEHDTSMDRLCDWARSMAGQPAIELIPDAIPDPVFEKDPGGSRRPWIIRLSFGPFLSQYGKSTIEFDTPDMRLKARGVQWAERNSMGYYDIFRAKADLTKRFQFIDEPSNSFHLEFERASEFSIGLKISHPKSVVSLEHHDEGQRVENFVQMEGVIDGVYHAGVENLYDSIYEIRLSRQFYEFQVTGDKIFTLLPWRERRGDLAYRAGVGAGILAGYAVVVRERTNGEWSEESGNWKPMGFSASLNQRLVYTRPKGALSISVGHTLSNGSVKAEVAGGTMKVSPIRRQSFSLSLGLRLGRVGGGRGK